MQEPSRKDLPGLQHKADGRSGAEQGLPTSNLEISFPKCRSNTSSTADLLLFYPSMEI